MDGILVINKPIGLSSHQCVSKVRKALNTKKVGHSGTLDVEASGVLVLGINKGTKLLNYLNQDDKIYQFTIVLGQTTDTLDHTGNVTAIKPVQSLESFDDVLASFKGTIQQVPPIYSAVKIAGKKLYEYARNQEEIPEIAPRQLEIYQLKRLTEIQKKNDTYFVECLVHASKGLYVRVLANDIALKLNTVGHTSKIHRLKAGQFSLDKAVQLEDNLQDALISMNDALPDYPEVFVTESQSLKIASGQTFELDENAPIIKCLDANHRLLAIYEKKGTIYKAKNVFI